MPLGLNCFGGMGSLVLFALSGGPLFVNGRVSYVRHAVSFLYLSLR